MQGKIVIYDIRAGKSTQCSSDTKMRLSMFLKQNKNGMTRKSTQLIINSLSILSFSPSLRSLNPGEGIFSFHSKTERKNQ